MSAAMTEFTRGVLAAGALAAGVALGEVLYRLLSRWSPVRRVRISLRLFFFLGAVYGAAWLAAPVLGYSFEPTALSRRVLSAGLVFFAVLSGARLVEGLLLAGALGRRAERAFPTLARQIILLAVVVVTVLALLDAYFQTPPSALLASSVVISAVVGLSLQQTLGSVAAGVALQSEQTFRLGDWVGIGENEGEVVRMTWRTVHLRTRENDVVIIPNDHAARSLIINYSKPSRVHATEVEVGTHYRHSPDLVRRVLCEATLAAEGVLVRPAPHIWVVRFDDFAVRYRVRFYLDDYAALPDIEARVMSNIWYHFRRNGIQIPFPIRTVTVTPDTERSREREEARQKDETARRLRSADLLAPLSDAEIDVLAGRVEHLFFGAGETLFEQDEPGDSCFLIERGRVAVRHRDEVGRDILLAELGPGAILGEMSLLTGDPRSARAVALEETAVIRIDHEAFGSVLKANPAIAESLAAILEERQSATAAAREAAAQAAPADAADAALRRRRVVNRILRFFGVRRHPPTEGPSPPSR